MPTVVPLLAAAAALTSVNIPDKIGAENIQTAGSSSQIEVLLPETLKTSLKIYPETIADPGTFTFYLDLAKGCFGAGACNYFEFSGQDKGKARGPKPVELAKGRSGRFSPSTCGANCSAPMIQWRERGNLYSVSFEEGKRRDVVKLANEAIRKGPR